MSRGDRWDMQQAKQKVSRVENGLLKRKERARRDARLKQLVQKGKLPFTPTVLSWLSVQLNKPGRYITQADVDAYLKGS